MSYDRIKVKIFKIWNFRYKTGKSQKEMPTTRIELVILPLRVARFTTKPCGLELIRSFNDLVSGWGEDESGRCKLWRFRQKVSEKWPDRCRGSPKGIHHLARG